MCEVLHRFLRRILPWSCLLDEWDWDALRSSDFAVCKLLSIPGFVQKTEFRANALKVVKSKTDIEREREKETKSDAVVKTVMGESFNPFLDQGRQFTKCIPNELFRHSIFHSDLLIGLACFEYGVLFKLPKAVAVDCFQDVLQIFSSRGSLARELRYVNMDDYVEFVDDIRHV